MAGGVAHSLALKTNGTVWAWGRNSQGELGNGTTVDSVQPVQVTGLNVVIAIDAGFLTSMALKADGTVWTWGRRVNGARSTVPVQVPGLTGVAAIGGGYYHWLAVKSDGTVWAWGENGSGQLGNGTKVMSLTPVQVNGLSGVVTVTGGQMHSLAVTADGTLWAWGNNWYQQTGNNSTDNNLVPVQVTGIGRVVSAGAGGYHSLAVVVPPNSMTYLGMNTVMPQIPFTWDARVRLAAYLALDRDSLATISGGQKVRSIMNPEVPNPAIDRSRDTATAKQLLRDSGYPNGFKTALTTYPSLVTLANSIKQQLAQVGIDCDIVTMPSREALFGTLETPGVQFFLVDTPVNWTSPFHTLSRLLRTGANENFARYYSPQFNTYVDSGSYRAAEDLAFSSDPVGFAIAPLTWQPEITPLTVATSLPTNYGGSSVRLNANLTALGAASSANVSFQWGISSGNLTAETPVQSMNTTGFFHFDLSGLSENTPLYFRAKASGDGTIYGAEYGIVPAPPTTQPPFGGGFGGGGGGGGALPGYTSLAPYTNSDGLFNLGATILSVNGNASVTIEKGTVARDNADGALKQIGVFELTDSPPSSPADSRIIGLLYDFQPEGAKFNPAISLTLKFDAASLPEGIRPSDLYIARWDGSQWQVLTSVADALAGTVTAKTSGFSKYAIVGKLASPTTTAAAASPARFSLSDVKATPATARTGETVTVVATVTNGGGTAGTCEVTLTVNGARRESKIVTLDPGSTAKVSFAVNRASPGTYRYDVNGTAGGFTVETEQVTAGPVPNQIPEAAPYAPPSSESRWLVLGIALIVIGIAMLGGLMVFVVSTRQRS